MRYCIRSIFQVCAAFLSVHYLHAAKIGELTDAHWLDQAVRFWTFQDPAVYNALLGVLFMGVSCGLLGGFIVVRRLALVGDTLSHAVLPGVAIGFLWAGGKDPWAIFVGAVLAGLLGTGLVSLIVRTTRIREDSALGMVLAGFYAVGICLFTMIQQLNVSGKGGLDKFLFGQAAALSNADVKKMGVIAFLAVVLVAFFYKEFLVLSFDRAFGVTLRIAARWLDALLMMLLAFAIVVSLQACGVVLVSAMLITPAAAAYLLTDRMHRLLVLSVLLGGLTGTLGAFLSFLGNGLPTGPFMVLAASVVFGLAFFFSPRYGYILRKIREHSRSRRIALENTLKSIYHVLESKNFSEDTTSLNELSQRRGESLFSASQAIQALAKEGFASYEKTSSSHGLENRLITLTHSGWVRACEIVRNHRLWELYLASEADYPVDHVHEDAEKIEHILGEATVRALERKLNFPSKDPHGKLIPSLNDMYGGPSI